MDDATQSRKSILLPDHGTISNSTSKKFSKVMAQYMRVHKISSLNPAAVSQAADYAGPQGDSYHQWDEYNPPTPTIDSRICQYVSKDQNESSDNSSITTPSLDNSNINNWGKEESSLPRPQGTIAEQLRDHNVSTPESTPSILIKEKSFHEQCPTSERAQRTDLISGVSEVFNNSNYSNDISKSSASPQRSIASFPRDSIAAMTPQSKVLEQTATVINMEAENSSCVHSVNEEDIWHSPHNKASSHQREIHPSFKFLPAKHHLQLPGTSRKLSDSSMNSAIEDDAMTSFWEDYGSQHQQTPPVFSISKSECSSEFNSTMEPDSLEKKPIVTSAAICESSVKKNTYDSNKVASCLPHLLMPEYTASPPYLPSENFNYVTDNQEAQQRRGSRTGQRNIQLAEGSSNIRNSFSGSSRIPFDSPGNEASYQAITTPIISHQVFDSLADTVKKNQKTRRNIWIGVSFMFFGALMGIIALAYLVKIGNKKFAPYNGMYPNGLNST